MLKIVGGIIVAIGGFLWLGNVFGFFPTFPLAGYLIILAGGAVLKAGAR